MANTYYSKYTGAEIDAGIEKTNAIPAVVDAALEEAKLSGAFAGAPGKDGYTPVKGIDYYTAEDKSEYSEYIASELAKRSQLTPEYAESEEWLNTNGDQTKLYVLPDGMIWAYKLTENEVPVGPAYINMLPSATDENRITLYGEDYNGDSINDGYLTGYRLSSSGTNSKLDGACVSGFIAAKPGDVIRIKGTTPITAASDCYIITYKSDNTKVVHKALPKATGNADWSTTANNNATYSSYYNYTDGVITITLISDFGTDFDAIRFSAGTIDGNTIVTVNQEIKEGASIPYTNRLPQAIKSDGTAYIGNNGEKGYKTGWRVNSSLVEVEAEGRCCTGFIPVKSTDVVRWKNIFSPTDGNTNGYVFFYKDDFVTRTGTMYDVSFVNTDKFQFIPNNVNSLNSSNANASDETAYMRISTGIITDQSIITVNQEIVETGTNVVTEYIWSNTGHAFVPTDYEDRIIDLETEVAQHSKDIEVLKRGISDDVDPITVIRQWDSPIYDSVPVWEISSEKAALTSADKTVDAIYAKYDALMAEHPDFITRTDLGLASNGETHIYRYDFKEQEPRHQSGFEWSETKPKFIIATGIHYEMNGIYGMFHALSEIASNSELAELRRNVHFIVVPVVNPCAIIGPYDVVGHTLNANKVEIHRNFEVGFTVAGQDTIHYTGASALSEVESQYLDNILKNNADAAYFLTCHSFDRDHTWGAGFLWGSSATKYMCNMAYRVIDKLGKAWHKRYGKTWEDGVKAANAYVLADPAKFPNAQALAEGDYRIGHAALTNTGGCEQRQATKYGIQATNFEVGEAFYVLDNTLLSSKAITHGAEAYVNFFLTSMGAYDYKDKKYYAG